MTQHNNENSNTPRPGTMAYLLATRGRFQYDASDVAPPTMSRTTYGLDRDDRTRAENNNQLNQVNEGLSGLQITGPDNDHPMPAVSSR